MKAIQGDEEGDFGKPLQGITPLLYIKYVFIIF